VHIQYDEKISTKVGRVMPCGYVEMESMKMVFTNLKQGGLLVGGSTDTKVGRAYG
jgi:hypothetical protein